MGKTIHSSIWSATTTNKCLGILVTDKTTLAHYTITKRGGIKKGFSEWLPINGYGDMLVVKYRGRGNPIRWLALRVLLITLRLRHQQAFNRVVYEV